MRIGLGQLMYVLFGADEDTLERARDQMLQLTAGWHRAEIEQLVEETLDEVADPLVYAEALFLIDEHKRNGRRVFLVSASPEQIVRPIGRHLGVTEIIATTDQDRLGRLLPPRGRVVCHGPRQVGCHQRARRARETSTSTARTPTPTAQPTCR